MCSDTLDSFTALYTHNFNYAGKKKPWIQKLAIEKGIAFRL